MTYRILSHAFFALAALLLVIAAGGYYWQSDAPGAAIEDPEREFPQLIVGTNAITYRLRNPTRHPVRVVGYSFC